MAEPNFEELNTAIRQAGAEWEAAPTSMSRFFGERVGMERFGLAFDPKLAIQEATAARSRETAAFAITSPPPPRLDWRSNGGNYVTPPKDQGTCGSCVAFATAGCLESRALIASSRPGRNFDLSEAHLFYCGAPPNSCAVGWFFDDALRFVRDNGVGLEKDFPYTPGNQACRQISPAVSIHRYRTAASTIARKLALTRGPVIAGMEVFDDFMAYSRGVYRHVTGRSLGWHAVLVIGYDDPDGCWIAKNSWSTGWGERGFLRIAYGQCSIDTTALFYDPDVAMVAPGVV